MDYKLLRVFAGDGMKTNRCLQVRQPRADRLGTGLAMSIPNEYGGKLGGVEWKERTKALLYESGRPVARSTRKHKAKSEQQRGHVKVSSGSSSQGSKQEWLELWARLHV